MEIFSQIFNYITDASKKLTHKAATIITIIIILFLIDNIYSITYFYNYNKKIELVKPLNSLLSDTTLSAKDKNHLKALRIEIINHKTLKDRLYEIFNDAFKYVTINLRSLDQNLLHFTTSNLGLLYIIVSLYIAVFKQRWKRKRDSYKDTTLQFALKLIIVSLGFIILTVLVSTIFSYIPIIAGNRLYNYCVFVATNLVIALMLSWDSETNTFNFDLGLN